jgi:hypothetical protein
MYNEKLQMTASFFEFMVVSPNCGQLATVLLAPGGLA